ncbi:hypothetical protein Prum_061050 [Phytohabitans rumicis]|uniref:Uncharacterized protein n=1 Tax=Phytohabitans rumicis TaxID=1076125 RepID=A0A6V8L5E0_9ACTN|nr:hypothetical protein Prum_061050 [Phytohabitans rumicis]
MGRRLCMFGGCLARAEFAFDPNLGVAPPEVTWWCAAHVGEGLALAFAKQRQRGDRWISLNIEPIALPGRPRARK